MLLDINTPDLGDNNKTLKKFLNALIDNINECLCNIETGNFNDAALTTLSDTIVGNAVKATVGSFELVATNGDDSSTITIKSGGIAIASANISFSGVVTFTDLAGNGTTVINGSNIKTGKITGIDIISQSAGGEYVVLRDGNLEIYSDPYPPSTGLPMASLNISDGAVVLQNMFSTTPLKITGVGNMSIDAINGTLYLGSSASGSNEVYIGRPGGRVDLYGDVYINGVLQ